MTGQLVAIALPAFVASLVEFVEALTIVLAVGTTRGWRSALVGTAAGVLVLALLIAVFGPALTYAPVQTLPDRPRAGPAADLLRVALAPQSQPALRGRDPDGR